jgi:hypothetical protein
MNILFAPKRSLFFLSRCSGMSFVERRINGRLHSLGAPSITYTEPSTGKILQTETFQNDMRHSIYGLASIAGPDFLVWHCDGEKHREGDLPAMIYGRDFKTSMWYIHGKEHRDKGPAYVNELAAISHWYYHGELDASDGPGIVNNSMMFRCWCAKTCQRKHKHVDPDPEWDPTRDD